jgi:hypothetical protein
MPAGSRFCRFGRGAERGVALLAAADVRIWVNGLPVLGGLRVLEHKDEILFGNGRFYYSAEATPVVATFRGQAGVRVPSCPICRGPLKDGDTAVQCPGCGRWFHQAAEEIPHPSGSPVRAKTCWTYGPSCRFCGHPTPLNGEPVWRPEMEENL